MDFLNTFFPDISPSIQQFTILCWSKVVTPGTEHFSLHYVLCLCLNKDVHYNMQHPQDVQKLDVCMWKIWKLSFPFHIFVILGCNQGAVQTKAY